MELILRKIIGVVAILFIVLLVYGTYLAKRNENIQIQQKANRQTEFDKGGYDKQLLNNAGEFNNLSEKFSKEEYLPSFCREDDEHYVVNGDDYDLKNSSYFEAHTTGGYYRSFDELLAFDHITKENFNYYRDFLGKYPFVHCIKTDLNLKANKNSLPLYAIKFEITNYSGYLYVSDGSTADNVEASYRDRVYEKLDRMDNTNWYKFKYRNEYGS